MHQIVKNPYLRLSEWAKQYGKLYTIQLGTKKAVVISDLKLLQEVFGNPAATGKFAVDTFPLPHGGPRGIINTQGKVWMEQRAFCVHALDLIDKNLDKIMLREVDQLVEWIKGENVTTSDKHGAIGLSKILQLSTINSLWTLVGSDKVGLDNHEMGQLIMDTFQRMLYTAKGGLMFFPWLKYMAQCSSGHNQLVQAMDKLRRYIEGYFDKHRRSRIPGKPRDLIDLYIEQITKTQDKGSSFYGEDGLAHSNEAILEVFISGGETIAFTLNFLLFYLNQHPEIQERLFQEVRTLDDKHYSSVPFLEAVILETLRFSSLAPLGVIHELIEEISCDTYTFPKGTLLIANLYHVHHNPKIWGDPDTFRPERFLEEDNPLKKMHLVPYQIGQRACPGDKVALRIITVFVKKLIRSFEVIADPEVDKEDYVKPEVNYLLLPKPVKLIMKERKSI